MQYHLKWTPDLSVVLAHHQQLVRRQSLPLGVAKRLFYELRVVGGEYSMEEETRYWKSRGARIKTDEVVFGGRKPKSSRTLVNDQSTKPYYHPTPKQLLAALEQESLPGRSTVWKNSDSRTGFEPLDKSF